VTRLGATLADPSVAPSTHRGGKGADDQPFSPDSTHEDVIVQSTQRR
jgi:hypothetical protein